MISSFRRAAERLYLSAVGWSLFFTVVRTGGNLLVLPLMLHKLRPEELGLWYVFLSLSGIAAMVDMGFSPTMTRVTAFIWAGAEEIQPFGVPRPRSGAADPVKPNVCLLAQLMKTMGLYYRTAGLVITILLASAGTLWIMHKTQSLPDGNWFLIAWFLFLTGVFINTTSGMWHPLLSGINEVRLNQQILALGLVANYLVLLVGLLLGAGLLAPVAGYLVMGIVARGAARAKFRRLTEVYRYESKTHGSVKLLQTLWPTAWRTGVVTVGLYATINLSTLICFFVLGLKQTASFGLSQQLVMAAVSIATTFIAVKIPLIAQMHAKGEMNQIGKIVYPRMRWFWAVYVGLSMVAIIFGEPVLRDLLHSKTPLLPRTLLAGLFLVLGLEGHHAIFREIAVTSHRNPFALPVVVSAILIVLLSLLLVRWIGIWGLILAPGIVQVCFNNWWTVLVGLRSMGNSPSDYVRGLLGQRGKFVSIAR